jgi:hypothetical protein
MLLPLIMHSSRAIAEWPVISPFSSLSEAITAESGPSVAWLDDVPAVAWAALPYGLGPATSIELGWFDAKGQSIIRKVTDIPATSPAFVELLVDDNGLVILFVRQGKSETDLIMAFADDPRGPWEFSELATGVRLAGLSGAIDGEGMVQVCWFDEVSRTLHHGVFDREGVGESNLLGEDMGRNPSLVLWPNAVPWIFFTGPDGATLWCAWQEVQEPAGWNIQQVGPGGAFPDAVLAPGGFPAVVHYDPLAEEVIYQTFAQGLPGETESVCDGPAQYLSLAFDPVGRPRIGLDRSELIFDDSFCSPRTHYKLEIAYPGDGPGSAWNVVTIESNTTYCITAGCQPLDLTRASLVFSPAGVPVVGFKQNCANHPMATHSVQLRAPVMPWSEEAQPPVITGIEHQAETGDVEITWSVAPGECYRVWRRSAEPGSWEAASDKICVGEDLSEISYSVPAEPQAAWLRVTRELLVE